MPSFVRRTEADAIFDRGKARKREKERPSRLGRPFALQKRRLLDSFSLEKSRACQQDQVAREKACHPEGTVGQGEQRLKKEAAGGMGSRRQWRQSGKRGNLKRRRGCLSASRPGHTASHSARPDCQRGKVNQVDSSLEENVALLYGDGHPTQRPEKQAGKDSSISDKKEMCPVC